MGDVHANDVRANQFELYLSILYSLYCNRPMHVHPRHPCSIQHAPAGATPDTRQTRTKVYQERRNQIIVYGIRCMTSRGPVLLFVSRDGARGQAPPRKAKSTWTLYIVSSRRRSRRARECVEVLTLFLRGRSKQPCIPQTRLPLMG